MMGFGKKNSVKKGEEPGKAVDDDSSSFEEPMEKSSRSSSAVAKSDSKDTGKVAKQKSESTSALFNSNPYLDARREWNERYGSYIAHARNWRFFSLGMLGMTLVQSIGLVVLGSQNKLVPYIVQVDKLGAPVAVNYAQQVYPTDERVIRFLLAQFCADLRGVVADGVVQRQMVDRVYALLPSGSQASKMVSEFMQNPNPFVKAQTMGISLEIKSMLKLSDKTWQIDWVETQRNLAGGVIGTSTWRASATITISPPDSEELIRANPIGLFITHLNVAEVKASFN
jgi:type IV secretion system protein VirB5